MSERFSRLVNQQTQRRNLASVARAGASMKLRVLALLRRQISSNFLEVDTAVSATSYGVLFVLLSRIVCSCAFCKLDRSINQFQMTFGQSI